MLSTDQIIRVRAPKNCHRLGCWSSPRAELSAEGCSWWSVWKASFNRVRDGFRISNPDLKAPLTHVLSLLAAGAVTDAMADSAHCMDDCAVRGSDL